MRLSFELTFIALHNCRYGMKSSIAKQGQMVKETALNYWLRFSALH